MADSASSETNGATTGYARLTTSFAYAPIERDLVIADGVDAVRFLQSQLSQDVTSFGPGESRWSFLLQPQGRIVALLRVTALDETTLLLDTEPGVGEPVRAALERFKIRTKCELAVRPNVEGWALRGPAHRDAPLLTSKGSVVAIESAWPWFDGIDYLPFESGEGEPTEWHVPPEAVASSDDLEVVRIEMGIPRAPYDIDDSVLPPETGIVRLAASFTKGCYVGQELVERIDARGRVNRHLRGLRSEAPLARADELVTAEGKVVGSVTSSSAHPDGRWVALAYVRREVEPGATVLVGPTRHAGTVEELPGRA